MHIQETNNETLVCLHGSAGSSRQWRKLVARLERRHRVLAPDLIGYGALRYDGRSSVRLDDEVDAILAQVPGDTGPFHLVGHAYGGAVALRLTCRHPERVLSLTLYEPAQFLALFENGLHSSEARELRRLHKTVVAQASTTFGRWRGAREFVNYGYGRNVWKQLSPIQKRRLVAATPKVAAEFNALMVADACPRDLSSLTMPVRILCGTRTRRTAKRICEHLAERIPGALMHWLEGLKHMAPVTDSDLVSAVIAKLIDESSALGGRVA